jgi:MFS family permease
MLSPALPLFARDLEVSLALIGLLASLQGVGAALTNVPSGLLVARIGGRRAMALGLVASGLGALALGISQSGGQLFLAVPLVGVGLSIWATSRLAFVADVAPVEQRGRALALVGGSSRVGMTLGPILGGVLGETFGIEAAFFGHAVMATLALVLVATTRRAPTTPWVAPSERAHTRILDAVRQHRGSFASAGSVAVSLVMLRSTRRVLMPLWGAWIGLDLAQIGLVIGLASAVDMTLFYPVGSVMDRFGRKWTIVPCLLTLSLSLAAIPLTAGFSSFLLVGLLGGFGNGLGSGAVMTMGADLAPRERAGEFLGVWLLIADSGGVVAPALAGALAQALTLGAAFFASAGIGLAGALLMALYVREGLTTRPGAGSTGERGG